MTILLNSHLLNFLKLIQLQYIKDIRTKIFFEIQEALPTTFYIRIHQESLSSWAVFEKYLQLTSIVPIIKEEPSCGIIPSLYNKPTYEFLFQGPKEAPPQILKIDSLLHIPLERYVGLIN